ncbi:MAG TPA: ATP-dependent Clp protease adapter ClpS [Legionellaceae bacterium]|nr:ATP-dependent Clp protease adapter ClpS [Legionellaceae bacterium]
MNGDSIIEPVIGDEVEYLTQSVPVLEEPKKYKVILQNDDYTPMNFVVLVLKRFFYMSESVASQLMLQVHTKGCAVCGVYTRDIAETKVVLVNEFARLNEHPLLCIMEQE